MADIDEITQKRDRLKALEEERDTWIPHWQEITDYVLPRKGEYLTSGSIPNIGKKKHSKIIDGTATRALRVLAAGMQGGLTSPARPWFRLKLPDEDLMEFGPVRVWLHDVFVKMRDVFNRSNFYTSIHSIYSELGGFGTALQFEDVNFEKVIHFRVMTVGEYCIATNDEGEVDTVYRRYWMTAGQILRQFGYDKLSLPTKQLIDNNSLDKWIQVVHAVEPNTERDERMVDNQNFQFSSLYFEYDNKGSTSGYLRKSGYPEFPYQAPRWDVTGSEIYGRSPGMDILAETKELQEVSKGQVKAIHLETDPPMRVPAEYVGKLIRLPGGINPIDSNEGKAVGRLFDFKLDIGAVTALRDDIRLQIRDGLFNDLFLMMIDTPTEKTATEIAARQEEKLLMLGPVIERQFYELLDPLIDRTFGIMNRFGMFRPPPKEIQGMPIDVEYVSLLAQAQKLVGTQAISAFTGFAIGISEIYPPALDKVDFDEAIDQYGDMTGVPPTIVRADDHVAVIRKKRAAELAKQQQMQQEIASIQGAKEMSETNTEGSNALVDLRNSMENI